MTEEQLLALAGDYKTNPQDLVQLATNNNSQVRALVGINPTTPIEGLWLLARNDYWGTRCDATKGANVTEDILKELAKDPESIVREAIAYHKSSSDAVLLSILKYERERIPNADPYVVRVLYKNPNLPAFAKSIIEGLWS